MLALWYYFYSNVFRRFRARFTDSHYRSEVRAEPVERLTGAGDTGPAVAERMARTRRNNRN